MRIDPIVPDRGLGVSATSHESAGAGQTGFAQLLEAAQSALVKADAAETAFAHGKGGLQEMVVERARADITLAVATSGAQRAAQALNTLLGMQI